MRDIAEALCWALAVLWASVEVNSEVVQSRDEPWAVGILCFMNLLGQLVSTLLVVCLFVIG